MVLIGILGRKRSGKDTMADYLVQKYDFHKITLAGPLKEACRSLFNFSDDQLYGESKEEEDPFWKITPRKALQYLGTDIIRNKINKLIPWIGDRFWLERFGAEYRALQYKYGKDVNVVLADLRFQNEIDFLVQYHGVVIKVERPNHVIHDDHESERLQDEITGYHHRIVNDQSIEHYYKQIKQLITTLVSASSS